MKTTYPRKSVARPVAQNVAQFVQSTFAEHRALYGILLFGLLTLLHAARCFSRFRYPNLFAEEGAVFLPKLLAGSPTLINAGYLNLFTFGLLAGVSHFTFKFLPVILSTIALLFSVLTFCYLLLPQWERFLPLRYRLAAVIFFLGFSPFTEGIAIALYGFWLFGVGAGFLTLELLYLPASADKWKWAKCLYLLVGALSGPTVFQSAISILLAGLILGVVREGAGVTARKYVRLLASPEIWTLFVCGLVQAYTLLHNAEGQHSPPLVQWLQFPQAAIHQANMRILVPTIFSHWLTAYINADRTWAVLSLVASAFAVSVLFFQRANEKRDVAWVLFLAAFFSMFIMYVGRGGMFDFFRTHPWELELGGMRYSFNPGVLLLLALLLAFTNLRSPKIQRRYAYVLLPLVFLSGLSNRLTPEQYQDTDWAQTARELEAFRAGRVEKVYRKIMPEGWTMAVSK